MRTRPYRLAVLAFDEMDLLDVAGPLEVFSAAGRKWNWRAIKAELIASKPGNVRTRAQLEIGPAADLGTCSEPELLLIPGGYGARLALEDSILIDYLTSIGPRLTLTLCVGAGALVAARAGLLTGADVAVSPGLAGELCALDASIKPSTVARTVLEERSISAAHSGAAVDLGFEVVSRLLGKNQAAATARELDYVWGTETVSVEIKL